MEKTHTLSLNDRKVLEITGITDVGTYSEDTVEVETVNGNLIIDGEGLSITRLDVEAGILSLIGRIDSILYNEVNKQKNDKFFHKLFK